MWAQDSFWQMYTKCLVSARHCIRCWGCTSEQDKAPTLWSLYSSEGVGREEEPSKQSHYDCVKALKKRDNKWKVVEMVPLNRMVWEELPEEKAQVEKRRSQSWEYSKTVVQAQRARVKLQRQERAAIFEEQNGAPWCSWIPPPSEEKEVYERDLDIQAEIRLRSILQAMARTINNVLGRQGLWQKKYEIWARRLRSKLKLKSHTSHMTTWKIQHFSASVSTSVKHPLTSKGCWKDQIGYYTQTYFII